MHQSRYIITTDAASAQAALRSPGAVAIGGGTDLVTRLADGLLHADALIDVRRIPGWSDVRWLPNADASPGPLVSDAGKAGDVDGASGARQAANDGELYIGGAVRLQQLADNPAVGAALPALAEACRAVGTPALRAMGTLAGNLCQAPRCWYWRGGTPCRRTDAALPCHAVAGHSEYHAIFDVRPCAVVHPSDPAVALLALGAEVEVLGSSGRRRIPLAALYPTADSVARSDRPLHDTTLAQDELIAGVVVPGRTARTRQRYVKLMQRGAWDFALVSCAAVRLTDGTLQLALGGVAARPWPVPEHLLAPIAEAGASRPVAELGRAVADEVAALAHPLAGSAYKVKLAHHLVLDALRFLTDPT